MIVTKSNFEGAIEALAKHSELGLDTETTCLPFWQSEFYESVGVKPNVFSIQFATDKDVFYFDFKHSSDACDDNNFDIIEHVLTSDPYRTWYIQNAPFDLNHLANHGVFFAGKVHCTKAIARVVNNLEESLKLDDLCSKYLGTGKDDVITKMKAQGHVTKLKKWGHNDKYEEILHFDRLTLDDLVSYGEKDTRLCFDLAKHQIKQIHLIDETIFNGKNQKLINVYNNECKLTKIIAQMARTGIKLDVPYCKEAYEFEVKSYEKLEKILNEKTKSFSGANKIDWLSARQLKPLFEYLGIPYTFTEKGNACFDKDALEASDHEIPKLVLKYRYHNKRAHTYFENFVWLADKDGILHADAQQAGTGFGRMSYWTPNLQNVPKRSESEDSKYKVRKCFVPRKGFFFADLDYKGAEYYMLVDYADEDKVISQLKSGIDPHKNLGDSMGISRDEAKTMQFRILYGAGASAVGKALGYKDDEANKIGKEKKAEYFAKMPGVQKLMWQVSDLASYRGYIFNWLGRLLKYDQKTAYKATNGLIQGGVGDMTKVAMVNLDEKVLMRKETRMLLQVHDAILFEISDNERDIIPQLECTMASAYPHKRLPMQVDAKFSRSSWNDLKDTL